MATNIVFRVDASLIIGTGHVMRCLALAGTLRAEGARCLFVCRQHDGHLIDWISREGYEVRRLPSATAQVEAMSSHALDNWLGTDWETDARQTLSALDNVFPDWLIVDHYALDARWERSLRLCCKRLMVIDDLADRPHDCDLLLDQNLVAGLQNRYTALISETSATLLGPAYALLQPRYAALHEQARARRGLPRRVFVFFGGVDRDNLTHTALTALLRLDLPELRIDVVVAENNPHREALEALVCDAPHFHLHRTQPTLGPMMLAADIAIGAGGTTSWERLCVGLPALVITVAENQHPTTEELHKRGLVRWLGDKGNIQIDVLVEQIGTALQQPLDAWSASCLEVVDGLGSQRVCAALLTDSSTALVARVSRQSDERQLLEWANDSLTRSNSFSAATISAEVHRLWFSKRLNNPDCRLYIVETNRGVAIGQVRFEREQNGWEVHFTLSPLVRGRGMGARMLTAALDVFKAEHSDAVVFGQVKSGNRASCRIFETLGFQLASATDADVIIYQSN